MKNKELYFEDIAEAVAKRKVCEFRKNMILKTHQCTADNKLIKCNECDEKS